MKLYEKQFDELEFSEFLFYHKMLKKGREEEERRQMRHAAFITYSLGAAGSGKSYEAYLSSLGLLGKSENRMNKDLKKKIAINAHANANKILDMLSKKKQNA